MGKHALSGANLASYDLCAVSNHHGTMNGGHYTSYCKPPQGDVWYQCGDKTVTRLRTPVKTSTAYLLFYDSVHADIRYFFCANGTPHGMVVVRWADVSETGDAQWVRWSTDACPVRCGEGGEGMMMWTRWETVSCGGDLDLSHYFPYPF